MYEYIDAVDIFVGIINALKTGEISPHSLLEEVTLKAGGDSFAYIDNRRDAKEKYDYDFWKDFKKQFSEEEFINWIEYRGINKSLLYSKSEQFPDFLFKVKRSEGKLICGSLFELKDSKGGSIASFNSTLPTKYKSLEEIDIINGNNLVSRVASVIDEEISSENTYHNSERRCFYLIRTHKGKDDKVKISVVDGSFFETVSKEHLIYQMFLNILRTHIKKKEIKIPPNILNQIEKTLSHITDQTIIASSQIIEKASVRPRLRIMAEVHPEGNPHSSLYPDISDRSVNLIIESSASKEKLVEVITQRVPGINIFAIHHKRNGEHVVFQFRF